MALVGRVAELAEIDHLLARAAEGAGGLLVLVGPAESGKTALATAAADAARRLGFDVVGGSPTGGATGRLVWTQLLADVGPSDAVAAALLADAATLDLDAAVRRLAAGSRRLIVVDDIDRGGPQALELLALLAGRLVVGATAVVATRACPSGSGRSCG